MATSEGSIVFNLQVHSTILNKKPYKFYRNTNKLIKENRIRCCSSLAKNCRRYNRQEYYIFYLDSKTKDIQKIIKRRHE